MKLLFQRSSSAKPPPKDDVTRRLSSGHVKLCPTWASHGCAQDGGCAQHLSARSCPALAGELWSRVRGILELNSSPSNTTAWALCRRAQTTIPPHLLALFNTACFVQAAARILMTPQIRECNRCSQTCLERSFVPLNWENLYTFSYHLTSFICICVNQVVISCLLSMAAKSKRKHRRLFS